MASVGWAVEQPIVACAMRAGRASGGMRRMSLVDLAATGELAMQVASLARAGDAILLEGPLGAGKTAFARAFLRAMADNPSLDVPSPSYTLVQSYDTIRGRVHHLDLWRLDGPAALGELGWDDVRGDIVLVEWPDRLGSAQRLELLPERTLHITLRPGADEGSREAILIGWPGRPGLPA